MYIDASQVSNSSLGEVVIKCPNCGNAATLDRFEGNREDIALHNKGAQVRLGHRKCPNRDCRAYILAFKDLNDNIIIYPPLRIDFDSSELPDGIKNTFEEAITCHSQECYVAAAIMVRRTMEEICADKGATGSNLKKRLEALEAHVVLPPGLIDSLDHLRLLGNDAAHIEAKDFDEVGTEEVEVAIEVTKEILKGIYQMDSLAARLEALKNKRNQT